MKKKLLLSVVILAVIIQSQGQNQTITNIYDVSKDAQVWSYDAAGQLDRGTNRQDIVIYEWTKDGVPNTKYGLIDFDLSSIPENATIIEAKLMLFHDPTSLDDEHSQLSGSNEAIISRITSEWDETVFWNIAPTTSNINATDIPASSSGTQDYSIDVTNLTQDIINDKSNSYGYLIKMAIQEHYRSLVFASSEHPNPDLHPQLKITYNLPCEYIELQASEGKDAQVWSYDASGQLDRGTDRQDIVIYEWTKDGIPNTKYGLIDFDFAPIPENATIVEANLMLFHDPSSLDDVHSQISGSNEAIISRITSEWDEKVYWNITPTTSNINATDIPASSSGTQDYSIDVTNLTQDIINDKSNSYGYLIKMAIQEHYRSLVFASGEHPNLDLRPKLKVCFQNSPVITNLSKLKTEQDNNFTIHPNPSQNFITIQHLKENSKLYIYNQYGVLTKTIEPVSNNEKIDISEMPSGLYIIQIGSYTTKLIVE